MGDLEDWETGVVRDPHTPPQALADIAERRYDLHPAIAAHPRVYPGLLQWMAAVNPASALPALPQPFTPGQSEPSAPPGPASTPAPPYDLAQQQPVASAPPASGPPASGPYYPAPSSSAQYYPISGGRPVPPPRRRNGVGCWLAGCGCLTLAGIFMVVLFVLGGLGSLSSSSGEGEGVPQQQSDAAAIAEQLAAYDAELATIRSLAVALDGNPAAPLVLDENWLSYLDSQATAPNLTLTEAKNIVSMTVDVRTELEQSIATAEQRRSNASGSVSERLVDEAGNGYIDITWDAAQACGSPDGGDDWETAGCVTGGNALTVHLVPDAEFRSDWSLRMSVAHELAHVYQFADAARFDDQHSDADRLLEQGLFTGSDEAMADCYALTYYGAWALSDGIEEVGYGYVCNEAERQAIRDWAASLHAPMPG
ncbi:hypothetical protein QFZ53_000136 [Microbacterium natoriense]|uniref:Leucine rich repeat variant domain-containing protein n=1 Tax=Microbacterium natoriense TaxID=284570 RepID=A0AAW8ERA2_9MICO|nr:hypothetical protein [Microbacterium natoriense]MDQ0645940.1 hypothetical protein [Microbacterium natoriense]